MNGSLSSGDGAAGGRRGLATPALVLDLDAFERNLARMAAHCRAHGLMLRPHAKSHKSVEVARRQIAAGAVGQCCATIGEAEAMADGGIGGLLVTSPIASAEAVARLLAVNGRAGEVMQAVDSPGAVRALGEAAAAAGQRLQLVVDVDVGLQRTGVTSADAALALAEQIVSSPALGFAGVQGYAGHVMHICDRAERRRRNLAALAILRGVRDRLARRGLAPRIVTGGGTGSFDLDPEAQVLTELQAGSYAFMDREYNDVWREDRRAPPFETALFVQTTVISANQPALATTDAGFKAFATDAGPPVIASGAPEGAAYFFFGDEHGGVNLRAPGDLAPGDVLACVTPHCDPTVNLYRRMHVVRGDDLVGVWPVASGR